MCGDNNVWRRSAFDAPIPTWRQDDFKIERLRNWRSQYGDAATIHIEHRTPGQPDTWLVEVSRGTQVIFQFHAVDATPDEPATTIIERLEAIGETVPAT